MLKYGLFIGLTTLSLACSDHDDKDSRSPIPLVTSTPAPITPSEPLPSPTLSVPKLAPKTVPVNELADDFGFTATYAKVQFPISAQAKGPGRVLVNKARVQVRKENDQAILDCRFKDDGVLDVRYVLGGRAQSPNAFLWINCLTLRHDLYPIQNIKELCDVYGCTDETVNGKATFKVKMEPTLWIDRESGLRVKDGYHTEMIEMTAGAPAEADFAFTLND